jgi:hypothetical protein
MQQLTSDIDDIKTPLDNTWSAQVLARRNEQIRFIALRTTYSDEIFGEKDRWDVREDMEPEGKFCRGEGLDAEYETENERENGGYDETKI